MDKEGYYTCPDNPDSCPAPPEWYPDLKKNLGQPIDPVMNEVSPYIFERKFQHAFVHLDLNNVNKTFVKFDSDINNKRITIK